MEASTVASCNSGFVRLPKMSTIKRESTITREIQAKIDNWSTEHIHCNERFHYHEIHFYPSANTIEATVPKV